MVFWRKAGIDMQGNYVNAKRQNALANLQRFGQHKAVHATRKGNADFAAWPDHFCPVHCHADSFHAQLLGITAFVATHGKYLKNFKLTLKDRLIIINLLSNTHIAFS
jgi:hypothetical protein